MTATGTKLPAPGQFETVEQALQAKALAVAAARRRKLLVRSWPVVTVLLLAAVYLLTITSAVIVGERSFASHNYTSATKQFAWLQNVNALQTWKPYYNTGTARYAGGGFFPASQDLEKALELVPKGTEEERGGDECLVAMNLSLTYEGLGDQSARASDPAMALDYYARALEQLEGCARGSGGGEGQESEAQESQDRKEDKQSEQKEAQNGGGDPGEEPGEEPTDQPGEEPGETPTPSEPTPDPVSEEERELAERNAEADREREATEQREGGGSGGGQGW